jgi:6-phosphofructokinase 1
MWIERSFGFASAVDEARRAVEAAHTEARGVWNGVGIVKLMGRYSGFIAAHATLASNDVNFCLVPEVPFAMEGNNGFLKVLERRIHSRQHAVIVVAEGAGQDLMPPTTETDASGNLKLQDVGTFLRDEIQKYFKARNEPIAVRYIDPSYLVRGIPANASDSELCLKLGQCAVHAGMAGRTNMLVGYWNQRFTHLPIQVAVRKRKQLDMASKVWRSVLSTTGQPERMLD